MNNNWAEITAETVEFIRSVVSKAGYKKLVVGLSGGVDSAVTAALSCLAVDAENVTGVMLPYATSHPDSLNDAVAVAQTLGIKYHVVPITPMVDAYFNTYEPNATSIRRGNFMARMRMCVLYDFSAQLPALVAGTGNKSELLVGYCTQYGDGACAFEPIGHLYKTQVWGLAAYLHLPEAVITKAPTADLWAGQTDEDEMGLTYRELDDILTMLVDNKLSQQAITDAGVTKTKLDRVIKLVEKSAFKRNLPPTLASFDV